MVAFVPLDSRPRTLSFLYALSYSLPGLLRLNSERRIILLLILGGDVKAVSLFLWIPAYFDPDEGMTGFFDPDGEGEVK